MIEAHSDIESDHFAKTPDQIQQAKWKAKDKLSVVF